MSRADGDPPYWSQDPSTLAAALESGVDGLSSNRAAAQLALVGPNSVEDTPRLSALRLLLRQFESPLVLILSKPPANGRWNGLFAWDEGCGGQACQENRSSRRMPRNRRYCVTC